MKQTIRLNERELHTLIRESVKRVLNEEMDELDMKDFPLHGDANTRNSWWQKQLDTDFPNHGIKQSNNWQDEYYQQMDTARNTARKTARNIAQKNKRLQKQAKFDADIKKFVSSLNNFILTWEADDVEILSNGIYIILSEDEDFDNYELGKDSLWRPNIMLIPKSFGKTLEFDPGIGDADKNMVSDAQNLACDFNELVGEYDTKLILKKLKKLIPTLVENL